MVTDSGLRVYGDLGATAWVVASNASARIKAWATFLQAIGYPVWICDGVADNVEIQAAHDALPLANGLIQLSEGTFNFLAGYIHSKSNVWLRGMGQNCSILQFSDGIAAGTNMIYISGNYPRISDLELNLNKASVTNATGDGIRITGGPENPLLEHLIITHGDAYAIRVITTPGGTGGLVLQDIHAWDFPAYIIYLDSVHSQTRLTNVWAGNAQPDVYGWGTHSAIAITNSTNVHLDGIDVWAFGNGLYLETCSQIFMARVHADRCVNYGIRIYNTTDFILTSSIIYGPGQNGGWGVGIGISAVAVTIRGIIANNQIVDSTGQAAPYVNDVLATGIHTWADADYLTITDNRITGATIPLNMVGVHNVYDKAIKSPDLDLSGGAIDLDIYRAPHAFALPGYHILYPEASSGDAGVAVRVGRYQDGVPLDDDYFDLSTSEINENKGYARHFNTGALTQRKGVAGDVVTVGTAGGKDGIGEVSLILDIAEIGE